MAKALNERQMAQDVLNDLALEIPSLQQTISALQHQVNPQVRRVNVDSSPFNPPDHNLWVPGLSKTLQSEPTEDELLPEPEGTPLLPED